MEIPAMEQFVNPHLVDTIPTEPGLYLYVREEQKIEPYPIIELVEIRLDEDNDLIGDSDNWVTWLPIALVEKEMPGSWSKKISFE